MSMTNTEKQIAFQTRMKAAGFKLRSVWFDANGNIVKRPATAPTEVISTTKQPPTPLITPGTVRSMQTAAPQQKPDAKAAEKKKWKDDLRAEEKAERLKAARKAGRDSERDKYFERGKVEGVVYAAKSVLKRNPVAAQVILHTAQVDRERAVNAGFDDFRLSELDKADAWKKPPEEFLREQLVG